MDITTLDILYLSLIGVLFVSLLCVEMQIHQIKVMIEERWLNGEDEMCEKYNNSKK